LKTLALFLVCFVSGCPNPTPRPAPVKPALVTPPPATRPLLIVKNECASPIWIQQQGMPAGTPSVTALPVKGSTTYNIPVAGIASTRFWVKTGCDATGQNCPEGQSSPPCPPAGCTPPIDSMIEATWGCDLPEAQCGTTPQGKTLHGPTWWNASEVGGYTVPYSIEPGANGGPGCVAVNCNELWQGQCPDAEDLSTGGKYPEFKSINLNVRGAGGAVIGCYSPCQALTQVGYGGKGIQPPSDPRAAMYCCPTPPISPGACKAGPVAQTKYVRAVHGMCHKTAYAYAYDDGVGLHTCTPTTVLTMTFCPPQPAK
jgi:hypothetical protein